LKSTRGRTGVVRRSLNLVRQAALFMHCTIIIVFQFQIGGARAKKQALAGKFWLAWILLIDK
jgi:hypothetical protein